MDRLLSIVLTVAAVAMAGVLVHREFLARPQPLPARLDSAVPSFDSTWRQLLTPAIRLGQASAPIQIVEFSDLECPYCRSFHATLRRVRERFGASVAVNLVHFPLPMHRFARPAARAAECAERQGRLSVFVDVVYNKQDSLGLKSWASYARDAQVGDTASFVRCAADTSRVPRIEAGIELGKRIQIASTPTVFVNGWRLHGTPSETLMVRVISDLLTGREPFDQPGEPRTPRVGPENLR